MEGSDKGSDKVRRKVEKVWTVPAFLEQDVETAESLERRVNDSEDAEKVGEFDGAMRVSEEQSCIYMN